MSLQHFSSPSPVDDCYDVFLSFRGPDARKGFATHLYHTLRRKEMHSFMDVDLVGEKIEYLFKVIAKSRMAVVIYSENFAASDWCLKELATILMLQKEGTQILLIPIFYKVDVSELKHLTGKTGEYLNKHVAKHGESTVDAWKVAVRDLSEVSGLSYEENDSRSEYEFIEHVTDVIKRKLQNRSIISTQVKKQWASTAKHTSSLNQVDDAEETIAKATSENPRTTFYEPDQQSNIVKRLVECIGEYGLLLLNKPGLHFHWTGPGVYHIMETEAGDDEATNNILSPAAPLLHAPKFNSYIVTVIGCKTRIDTDVIKAGLPVSLLKHPRFSSKVVHLNSSGKVRWVRTTVNLDDHVIIPDIDPNHDSPDRFIEDYVSYLTTTPLDLSRPLWEMHILNIKTSDAEAVAILRVHHSVGDGTSLMSFFLACTRKTVDPDALPTLPEMKKRANVASSGGLWWLVSAVWWMIRLVWNSVVDGLMLAATLIFLEDTKTPIRGNHGVSETTKRFVHRIVSLDDIKLVKNELNMTVNDVLLGVTQAGLSEYLSRRYAGDEKKAGFLKRIRLRGIVLVNLRPTAGIKALSEMIAEKSKAKWGNLIGFILLPFSITHQQDPLAYIRQAKATIDRKKLSLEPVITSLTSAFLLNIFGSKVCGAIVHKFIFNTTLGFSNMIGPVEEISYCGHPIAYISPTTYGVPLALMINFQSYVDNMTIVVTVDPEVIPDPHLLCDYFEKSLSSFKAAVLRKKVRDA